MKNFRALAFVLACAACASPADVDSDTDDLSATTYSMQMLRANPSLLPEVQVPQRAIVAGRGRPLPAGEESLVQLPQQWQEFLYGANQLGQFLQLTDPAAYDKTDATAAPYARKPGDLFSDAGKLTFEHIAQGYLGDCYFAASLDATYYAVPSTNLIVAHKSGTKVVAYDVTFFQANGRKVKVEVDPDLMHGKKSGNVYYMTSTETKAGYEEWAPSLIEKAYAQWQGSYKAIGSGGAAADAIHALTGKVTNSYQAKDATAIAAIEKAGKNGKPQVACTFGDKSGVKYPTGIYSDHCYTLRGIHRVGSDVFVQLRNPWGPGAATDSEPTEPPTADGNPDGLFEIPAAQFAQLYDSVDIVP